MATNILYFVISFFHFFSSSFFVCLFCLFNSTTSLTLPRHFSKRRNKSEGNQSNGRIKNGRWRERNKTTGKNIYVKNFEKECGARLERRAKQRTLSKEKKYNKSLHQIINTVDAFYVFLVCIETGPFFFFLNTPKFFSSPIEARQF